MIEIRTRLRCSGGICRKKRSKRTFLIETFQLIPGKKFEEINKKSKIRLSRKHVAHHVKSLGLVCPQCKTYHLDIEKGYTDWQVEKRLEYSSYYFSGVCLLKVDVLREQLQHEPDDYELYQGTVFVQTTQLWMGTPLIAASLISDPSIGYVMVAKTLEDIHLRRNFFLVSSEEFKNRNKKEALVSISAEELEIFK